MKKHPNRNADAANRCTFARSRLFLACGALIAISAKAQTTDGLEEVVVTAQFKAETIQSAPLAISATNGETLEARGQSNVTNFAAQVPSLYIQEGGAMNGPSATVALRGIGQGDPTFALEPGVGIYIDDVYYSTVTGSNFDLLDLDRIEVLRGPQGTLAGKNSIGGALKLYSKAPDGNLSGFVQATIGRYDRRELQGGVNVPLIDDRLFARVSAMRREVDGFMKVVDYGCAFPNSGVPASSTGGSCTTGHLGGIEGTAARAALRLIATDDLEINLIGDYSRNEDELPAARPAYIDRAAQGLPPYIQGGVPLDNRFIPSSYLTNYSNYSANGFSPKPDTLRDVWGSSITIDYMLNDELALKSITAYREQKVSYVDDLDMTPLSMGVSDSTFEQQQFTQEIRLEGSIGDLAEYAVGTFYFSSDGTMSGHTEYFPLSFLFEDNSETTSKSAFAHATYHITDDLDFTAGIRYTGDEREYSFKRADPNGGVALGVGLLDGLSDKFEANRMDYRANVSYRFSYNVMGYAQWSTGFKGGGANPRPVWPNQFVEIDPEELQTWEIGLKADFWDNKARANVALFFNDYSDIQLLTSVPFFNSDMPVQPDPFQPGYNPPGGTAPAFVIQNGGEGETKGIEVELTLIPVDGLNINASASYMDFDFVSLMPSARASGMQTNYITPFTPEWKGSIGAQYDFNLDGGSTIRPRIDVAYQSETYAYAVNNPLFRMPGRTLLNGRITYLSPERDWEFALSGTNLTDKRYRTSVSDLLGAGGTTIESIGRPREWMLSAKYSF